MLIDDFCIWNLWGAFGQFCLFLLLKWLIGIGLWQYHLSKIGKSNILTSKETRSNMQSCECIGIKWVVFETFIYYFDVLYLVFKGWSQNWNENGLHNVVHTQIERFMTEGRWKYIEYSLFYYSKQFFFFLVFQVHSLIRYCSFFPIYLRTEI